ncbi:MAG: hypothetical protein LBQ96_03740 [Fusobacteriaceae bacterium]|nr:hypothetical protein [Fusobacteriaceae bacterium]
MCGDQRSWMTESGFAAGTGWTSVVRIRSNGIAYAAHELGRLSDFSAEMREKPVRIKVTRRGIRGICDCRNPQASRTSPGEKNTPKAGDFVRAVAQLTDCRRYRQTVPLVKANAREADHCSITAGEQDYAPDFLRYPDFLSFIDGKEENVKDKKAFQDCPTEKAGGANVLRQLRECLERIKTRERPAKILILKKKENEHKGLQLNEAGGYPSYQENKEKSYRDLKKRKENAYQGLQENKEKSCQDLKKEKENAYQGLQENKEKSYQDLKKQKENAYQGLQRKMETIQKAFDGAFEELPANCCELPTEGVYRIRGARGDYRESVRTGAICANRIRAPGLKAERSASPQGEAAPDPIIAEMSPTIRVKAGSQKAGGNSYLLAEPTRERDLDRAKAVLALGRANPKEERYESRGRRERLQREGDLPYITGPTEW